MAISGFGPKLNLTSSFVLRLLWVPGQRGVGTRKANELSSSGLSGTVFAFYCRLSGSRKMHRTRNELKDLSIFSGKRDGHVVTGS